MTRDIHATLRDNGVDHDDDVFGEDFTHGTEGSPAHRTTLAEAGVSAQARSELLHEVKHLCETLSKTQGTLEAEQTWLQTLKQQ